MPLSQMPGLPVTGVLYNPRSHRNLDAAVVEPDYPVIRVEQPRRRRDLKAAMQRFVDSGVELLVINGGDGTVRDALTGGAMVFGDRWPDFAVLPRGKTNALAIDLGLPHDWTLEQAIIAHRDGGRERRTPLQLEPLDRDGDALTRLGFILGAGAFVRAIKDGQDAHRLGAFDGLAVGLTTAWSLIQALLGGRDNPWRHGSPAQILLGPDRAPLPHSRFGAADRRALAFISTLTRFPGGLRPFPGRPGPIHVGVVDSLRRRIVPRMPAILRGANPDGRPDLGLHILDAQELELALGDRFILDGETFAPGRYRVTTGPDLGFVVP